MPGRRFTDNEEKEISKIYLSGVSERKLAVAYDCSRLAIRGALRRTDTPQRTPDERNRLYQIEPYTFDVIDTPEKAYWWGMMYADGTTYKRSFSMTLKYSDRYHLEKFRNFLKSEHPIKDAYVTIESGKYKKSIFYATEEHLTKRIKELGVISRRKNFDISELPEEFYHFWILGIFDGDGSISISRNNPEISFCCPNKKCITWVKDQLLPYTKQWSRKPDKKIQKHKTASAYYISYHGRNICAEIYDYLYQDAKVFLERKHKRFIKYLK